jgi:hypothetical protein
MVFAPLAGSAMSLLDTVRPNVAAGFRSDPNKGPCHLSPPNSDETGAIACLPLTKEGQRNFRDFASLIYFAFGVVGLAYS